jgi:hypothetical protein
MTAVEVQGVLAARADAPVARIVGFAPDGRSHLLLWVTSLAGLFVLRGTADPSTPLFHNYCELTPTLDAQLFFQPVDEDLSPGTRILAENLH